MDTTATISEYEKLRLANIERNKDFLNQIGISNSKISMQDTSLPKVQKKKRNSENKIPDFLLRKSLRVSQIPAPNYKEDTNYEENVNNYSKANPRPKKDVDYTEREMPSKNSSRALEANINYFLDDKVILFILSTFFH